MAPNLRKSVEELLSRDPEKLPVVPTADVQKLIRELERCAGERSAELRESEERFRVLFEEIPDACFLIDLDGRFVDGNKAVEHQIGYSREELIGQSVFESGIFPPIARETAAERIEQLERGGKTDPITYDLVRKDGTEIAVEVTSMPIRIQGKTVILSSARDLTFRKQAERMLAESEERFRMLFEEAPDASFLLNLDGRFIDGNKAAERLVGYGREELVGQSVFEFGILPSSAHETAAGRFKRLARDERIEPTEYSLVCKDGSEIPVEITSMPIRIRGKIVVLSSLHDLAFRKQAERMLSESETRFRELFKHMESGVAVFEAINGGADFIFKDINAAGQRIIGIKREDVIGRSVLELFPEIRELGIFDVFPRVWRTGDPEQYPTSIHHDDGRVRRLVENHMYRLPSGELVTVFADHTAQKQAEQDLQESEEKYRLLFESESDAILIFDGETRQFIDVNNAAVASYGYSREEFLQLTHRSITAEPEFADRRIPATLAGQCASMFLSKHRKKDGTVFPVEITGCTFSWKGRPVVCGVIRDITERVNREKELVRNREELRQLASELSIAEQREQQRIAAELHDGVSQLLSSASIRLGVLKETPLPDTAISALDTVCGIIDQTLQQTRSLTFELSCPMLNELGLAEALEELCTSMTHEYSVRFEFKGDKQPLPLHLDHKIVLYRSTRELLINVMKHSGAQCAQVDLERVGKSVRIRVADDGRGFDASMAGKGFSPSGGFGLFNIREYLRHAGGKLKIESIPGDGTRVALSVPLEEEHG